MVYAIVMAIFPVCYCAALVWEWVALISEAIDRRTGSTRRVPYPDVVMWAYFGKVLLCLGFFGGAFTLAKRPQEIALRWWARYVDSRLYALRGGWRGDSQAAAGGKA